MAKIKLNEEKKKIILNFLQSRFDYLEKLRDPIDREMKTELELYNDIDKEIEAFPDWKQKATVPYLYTIVQTMVARILQSLYGKQNYLKIYMEDEKYKGIEKKFREWVQKILDSMRFKYRGRDFLEDSFVQRTTWLHLYPVMKPDNSSIKKVDFNVYEWFDVWFDTKAKEPEDTDYFVRKIFPLWKIKENPNYFDTDKIKDTIPPDDIKKRQVYKIKNGVTYYDPTMTNNVTDEVEIKEYYGHFDIDFSEKKPKYKVVLFTIANDELLIRAETIELKTNRKILMFPIRPMRQANSLIGKSVPQIAKKLQHRLNYIFSHLLTNYRLNTGLMYKYRRDSGILLKELFAEEGNAIGFEESPDDISVFDTPNTVQLGVYVISQIIQLMQQLTGAVDYVMGTTMGSGQAETATGTKLIADQAMFKFSMMAENVVGDLYDFIKYIIILWRKYGEKDILIDYPEFVDFFKQTDEEIESLYTFDIGLNDLTMRRDIERSQYINLANILAGLIQSSQGNMPEFLRTVMNTMEMENVETILEGAMTAKEQMEYQLQLAQQVQAQQQGQSPQSLNNMTPEEEESQVQ